MRTTKEVQVKTVHGPTTFTLVSVGGMTGGRMLVAYGPKLLAAFDLIKNVAPHLANGGKAPTQQELLASVMKLDVSAVAKVLSQLSADDFEGIACALLFGAQGIFTSESDPTQKGKCDLNTRADLDAVFSGRVFDLFKLLGEAIALNYRF